jgi:pheromone shutdown protein TraB
MGAQSTPPGAFGVIYFFPLLSTGLIVCLINMKTRNITYKIFTNVLNNSEGSKYLSTQQMHVM